MWEQIWAFLAWVRDRVYQLERENEDLRLENERLRQQVGMHSQNAEMLCWDHATLLQMYDDCIFYLSQMVHVEIEKEIASQQSEDVGSEISLHS